jgi:hypothetical protein
MNTVFRDVFGNSPIVRVIDFFLDNQEFEYSLADVIREENISFQTAQPIFVQLIDSQVLVQTGKEKKAKKYVLDTKHPVVQRLVALDNALIESKIMM